MGMEHPDTLASMVDFGWLLQVVARAAAVQRTQDQY